MKLYSFFRSSASYRVRIALTFKGLGYEQVPIHLRRNGGEQFHAEYKAVNPQELVPTLVDAGRNLSQSLAIIEYLEERFPDPPLLPKDPADRATVRAMALVLACEVHPLQNLRVLVYLKNKLNQEQAEIDRWSQHWIALGLSTLETMMQSAPKQGNFCFGDTPTLADICLVPQLANARRFNCDLTPYPTLMRIEAACLILHPFIEAIPENQPDAE